MTYICQVEDRDDAKKDKQEKNIEASGRVRHRFLLTPANIWETRLLTSLLNDRIRRPVHICRETQVRILRDRKVDDQVSNERARERDDIGAKQGWVNESGGNGKDIFVLLNAGDRNRRLESCKNAGKGGGDLGHPERKGRKKHRARDKMDY